MTHIIESDDFRGPEWEGPGMSLLDRLSCLMAEVWLYAPRISPAKPLQTALRRRARALGAEYFKVHTPDHHRLEALYLPPVEGTPRRLPVLFIHGYMECKEFYLYHAQVLRKHGHGVLMFDLRAHGRSTGRCMSFGTVERHDAVRVVDEAARLGYVNGRLLSMGMSFGGATVLQHASHDPRVVGVVSCAPFADPIRTVRSYRDKYARFASDRFVFRGFCRAAKRAGFDINDGSTLESIRRIKAPVLLVVGEKDDNLSAAAHTRVLHAAAGCASCRLVEVPEADHFKLMGRHWHKFEREVTTFCAAVSEEAKAE